MHWRQFSDFHIPPELPLHSTIARKHAMLNNTYYRIKPLIPRRLQISLRRIQTHFKRLKYRHIWPIDPAADGCPKTFTNWPGRKKFALVLTHDVDTADGQNNCLQLMNLEAGLGFRSSFNFVPERYHVSSDLRKLLSERGFEIGVHGLIHDGQLFRSRQIFSERSKKINDYLRQWNAVGFRAPAMHHNLDWIHDLNIEYDASTFDTDPFEPMPDGCGTIFPFLVHGTLPGVGYVELPYTLPQDFTVLVLMGDHTMKIWQKKFDWLVQKGGMALLNTHPDYMAFGSAKKRFDTYPASYYAKFLLYVRNKYSGQYWHALPKEVARYWRLTQCKN